MTPEQKTLLDEDCHNILKEGCDNLQPLRGDTILITGGTGFLGTWIAEIVAYLNDNCDFGTKLILISTNANTFSAKAPHLALRPDVTLQELDIRNIAELNESVNWIIHAAADPDSRLHVSDPLRVIDVMVNGTRAVMSAATRLPRLKNILHISSGWVCASPSPSRRADASGGNPNDLGAVYAESKRCAETVCAAFRAVERLHIAIARPIAFMGPYQSLDKPWAVNNFFRDALLGNRIRILGNPQTVRSYLYASDMAFWTLNILAHGTSGECYDVGSSDSVTLHELANRIATHCGAEVSVPNLHKDARIGAPLVADVQMPEALGLKVTVELDAAIERTLRWNRYAIGVDSNDVLGR
jgi:nucleoside-diphosphate-sugar epimerase